MRKFFEIMEKDIHKDNFTRKEWLVYGILVPVIMMVLMGIAGWLETKSGRC